jgi:putative hydrolases of HD superfamily
MSEDRLAQQIAFLIEADKLKQVIRRTPLVDSSRRENSAEHSWHLVVAAVVLREHAAEQIDLLRVLEMLAVHDLVEIDAGDTFAYDAQDLVTKTEREQAAADRVFALLPPDQASRCVRCGKNSRRVRRRTRVSPMPWTVCSHCCRTHVRRVEAGATTR